MIGERRRTLPELGISWRVTLRRDHNGGLRYAYTDGKNP